MYVVVTQNIFFVLFCTYLKYLQIQLKVYTTYMEVYRYLKIFTL